MCGIHASISKVDHVQPSTELRKLLCQRGPDHLGYKETTAPITSTENVYLAFTSSVLGLRGGHVTAQPFVDPVTDSVFCWNGEAWKIGDKVVEENDGKKIFQQLLEITQTAKDKPTANAAILGAMSSISGPFAFIYFDKTYDCFYFGRDRLGRRSLLYNLGEDAKTAQFCSVADPEGKGWVEVEANGLYLLSYTHQQEAISATENLESFMVNSEYKVSHYPWATADSCSGSSVSPCIFHIFLASSIARWLT